MDIFGCQLSYMRRSKDNKEVSRNAETNRQGNTLKLELIY